MSEVNPKGLKEAEGALLLADGDPSWLLNIFSTLADSPNATDKGIVAVIYIIMYEAGFYFLDGPQNSTISYDIRTMRCLKDPNILLEHMTMENNQYVSTLSHKLIYPNVLKVVAYPVRSNECFNDLLFVVNFFSPDSNKLETFPLNAKTLISFNPDVGPLIAKEKLHFISSIKNSLCSFKSTVGNEVYNPHHILSLPLLVLHLICHKLDVKSFTKFILTCKFLYETFSDDETMWKKYSLYEYSNMNKSPNESWKEHYMYLTKNKISEFPGCFSYVPVPCLPVFSDDSWPYHRFSRDYNCWRFPKDHCWE